MTRAEKYIRIEETLEVTQPSKRKVREDEPLPPRKRDERRHVPPQGFAKCTPLKVSRSEVLVVAERQGLIEKPKKLRDNPKRQRSDKYCRFHRDNGHTTEDCHHLKIEIEKLIQRGYLQDFVADERNVPQDRIPRDPPARRSRSPFPRDEHCPARQHQDNLPTAGVINVIVGGPAGGDSSNARKSYLRTIRHIRGRENPPDVNVTQEPQPHIAFGDEDLEARREPHNDALVVSASLANYLVKKILIDSGSSADIIFYEAFRQLGIDNAQLQRVNTPLVGFSGEAVEALGEVLLPLSLGSYSRRATKMIKFLVVQASSAYNVILGRPSLNLFQAVVSTYHMKMKFPTPEGPGEAKGDQIAARECYVNSLRGIRPGRWRGESQLPGAFDRNSPTMSLTEAEGDLPRLQEDLKRRKLGVGRLESAEELKIVELFLGETEEIRESAYTQAQKYKCIMAKAYNAKLRGRSFQVCDLALRKAKASGPTGKLDAE